MPRITDVTVYIFTEDGEELVAIEALVGSTEGDTTVAIEGTGFQEGARVTFEGGDDPPAEATIMSLTDTLIQAYTPARSAGEAFIWVRNPDGIGALYAKTFTYSPPPEITEIVPSQSRTTGGRVLAITGTGFLEPMNVTIGDEQAEVTDVTPTEITAIVPPYTAGTYDVKAWNEVGEHTFEGGFTYTAGPAQNQDQVQLILDGEGYFQALAQEMDNIKQQPRHPKTYVRLGFWMIKWHVRLGHQERAMKLNDHIREVVEVGHNVDVIVWCPKKTERAFHDQSKAIGRDHEELAERLAEIDRYAAGQENQGRVRTFLERYEGVLGSSNHQKIAIFSVEGQRTVLLGGLNLAAYYWDTQYHTETPKPWHDTAIRLRGPETDDIEAEWMRRWQRARNFSAAFVKARPIAFGHRNTIGKPNLYIATNETPQKPPEDDTFRGADIQIATTRSRGSQRFRELRDLLLERIGTAEHYVYMENCYLTDPEIVRALYTRMNDANINVVIVTNAQDGYFGYMTRRSWLQLVLRLEHPHLSKIYYEDRRGEHEVERNDATLWEVHDSYDENRPTRTKWLEGDKLQFQVNGGRRDEMRLEQITKVECDFHFYMPVYQFPWGNGGYGCTNSECVKYGIGIPDDGRECPECHSEGEEMPCLDRRPVIHSKLAIIDNRYLIVGTANWTYRSMQYDGEMTAFMDSPDLAILMRDALLNHYQTWGDEGDLTLDNIEERAQNHIDMINDPDDRGELFEDEYVILPLDHADFPWLWNNRRRPSELFANYTWI